MSPVKLNGSPAGENVREDSFLPLLFALVVMLISLPLLESLPLLMPAVASLVLVAGSLAVLRDRSFRAIVIGSLVVCLSLRWGAHFWGNSIPNLILLYLAAFVARLIGVMSASSSDQK